MPWEQNQRFSFVEALFSGVILEELIFPYPEFQFDENFLKCQKEVGKDGVSRVVDYLFKKNRSIGEIVALVERATTKLEQPYKAKYNDQLALIDLIRYGGTPALQDHFFQRRSVPGGGIYIDLFSYRDKRGVLELFDENGVEQMSGVIAAKNRAGFGVFLGLSGERLIPCCIELKRIKRKKQQLIFDHLEIDPKEKLSGQPEHRIINRYLSVTTLLQAAAVLGRVKGVLDYIFTRGGDHLRYRSEVARLLEQTYQLETLCYMGATLVDYRYPRTFFDTFAIKSNALNCWNSFLRVMVHSGDPYLLEQLPQLVEEISFEGEELERITLAQIALEEQQDQNIPLKGAFKSPFKLFSAVSRMFVQQISASVIESGFKRIAPQFQHEGEIITGVLKQLNSYINRRNIATDSEEMKRVLTFVADIVITLYSGAVLLSRGSGEIIRQGEEEVLDRIQLIKYSIHQMGLQCEQQFTSRQFLDQSGHPGFYEKGHKSGGYYLNLIDQ